MKSTTYLLLASMTSLPAGLLAAPPEGPPVHSNIKDVEAERDRGAGRIVDPQTHELDRMDDDRREFEQLESEYDRRLRIERQRRERERRVDPSHPSPAPTTAPLNDVDLYPSDLQGFVAQSDRDLDAARRDAADATARAEANREQLLRAAERQSDPTRRERLRARAVLEFASEKLRIDEAFRLRRQAILGWPATAPATNPTR